MSPFLSILITTLQAAIIGLCLWGELNPRIRSTVGSTICLAIIAFGTLLAMCARLAIRPGAELLMWMLIAGLVAGLVARLPRERRADPRRRAHG